MKDSMTGGKAFVESVAQAGSKEELRRILTEGGVRRFDEETLESSYRSLALSQHWDAVWEMFQDKDFDSCRAKLQAHGMDTTRENFDLINEVIATGSDESLIAELRQTRDIDSTMEVLHRHGYHVMTADFLLLVREQAAHLVEDGLLTPEEIKELSGRSFPERCRKSINLIFALSTIAGLALGVSGMADPALLLAIASGISLIYGTEEPGSKLEQLNQQIAQAVAGGGY